MKHFLTCSFLLASACSSPLAPAYVPPANPPHKLPQPVAECAIAVTVLGSSAKDGTLKVRNDDRCERRVGIAVYVIGSSGQTLFAHVAVMAAAGETVELKAALPSCARYQFDPYHTLEAVPADGNFGKGEYLFPAPYFGDTLALCPPPPDPVDPPVVPPVPPVGPPPPPVPPVVPPPPPTIPGAPPAPVPGLPPAPVPPQPPPMPRDVCTVDVSLFSYHKQGCAMLPQTFIDGAYLTLTVPATANGSCPVVTKDNFGDFFPGHRIGDDPEAAHATLAGQTARIRKVRELFQVDLYFGRVDKTDLTEANFAFYDSRAITWIWDSTGCR